MNKILELSKYEVVNWYKISKSFGFTSPTERVHQTSVGSDSVET